MCYTEGEVQQSLKTSGVKRPMGEGDPHNSGQIAQDIFVCARSNVMSLPFLIPTAL